MYKSPIDIIEKQMRMEFDDGIWKAVQDYAVFVDKEELIQALRYDRDQYEKGYADGKRDAMEEIVRCKDCKYCMSDICYHDFGLNFMRGDDYCSYGERRES